MNTTTPTRPVARKRHACSTCLRWIDPGEPYHRVRCFDSGDAWTFRQCQHCCAVRHLYDPTDYDDCVSFDSYECWSDEPRTMAEARAAIGWRRRWRRKDGALMPVPTASR